MADRIDIQIFGDSILRGVVLDPASKRYYPITEEHFRQFEEKFSIKLHNRSSFGCIIEKGYRKLRSMLSREDEQCDAVILEYGGNDCNFDWKEVAENPDSPHEPNTPLSVFKRIYVQMIEDIKSRGIVPVIMSLPPICAERYFNWITRTGLSKERILSWLGDIQTIARYQELYSLAVTEIALKTNSLLIDIRSAFLERRDYRDLICEDGIHPNRAGHDLIAKVCEDFAAAQRRVLLPV